MPECFDTLDTAFAAVARDKEKKRLWTMQWKVNTWTFTGHAEERMLLNFGALYTQFAVASGQIPTVIIYNSDSPCTVDDPRASSFLQPRSCSAKLTYLAKRYPFAQFTIYYYKAYHGGGSASKDGASSSSSAGSTPPNFVSGDNIELLPFTPELRELCAQNNIK